MDILNNVLFMGASQGLLLVVIILSLRPANPSAKGYLALFVGLESMHLFCLYLIYISSNEAPPLALRLLFGFRALAAPSIYLYICALTKDRAITTRRLLPHSWVMLPVLIWFVVLVFDDHWADLSTVQLQSELSTIVLSMFVSCLFIGYGRAALKRLNQHSLRLEQALSTLGQGNLQWLQWLIIAMISIHCSFLALDIIRITGLIGPELKIALNVIITTLLIYLISIGGLRQPAVFTQSVARALTAMDDNHDTDSNDTDNKNNKYAKSGLDTGRIDVLWTQLKELMEQQQPYLDYTMDLPKLAKMLGARPQEVSQVINTASGGTFYKLMSEQRVAAAKTLLGNPDSDHMKMLDVALAVGFSSQSTFYGQFKKLTGLTPVAYRENAKAQQ